MTVKGLQVSLLLLVHVLCIHSFGQIRLKPSIKRHLTTTGALNHAISFSSQLYMAKEDGPSGEKQKKSRLSRRRNKIANAKSKGQPSTNAQPKPPTPIPTSESMSVQKAATRGPDNTPIGLVEEDASVEEVFGLGNEQLRELMEQELPVPREDLVTGTTQDENEKDPNKVFNLPDLDEYMRGDGGVRKSGGATQVKNRFEEQREAMTEKKVDRSDAEEYSRVLELNPFADADESMFTKEYDSFQGIFGEGKLLRIPIPYLQTGHGILLVIILIAAFVEAPGNPLTEWPGEYRQFFQEGLMYTFSINLVLSIQAFLVARKKNLPSAFWAVKCLLLGGVAFYEVQEATDPLAAADPFGGNDPSDRKSRR